MLGCTEVSPLTAADQWRNK